MPVQELLVAKASSADISTLSKTIYRSRISDLNSIQTHLNSPIPAILAFEATDERTDGLLTLNLTRRVDGEIKRRSPLVRLFKD
ncbi:hypothetical protein [Bradyrhizobium genosp. A]|uniref:hypothetical protein n=1 Tax=Bradyrhizobium genosp. A TaxID=83626 RepID=UPI003CEDEBD3